MPIGGRKLSLRLPLICPTMIAVCDRDIVDTSQLYGQELNLYNCHSVTTFCCPQSYFSFSAILIVFVKITSTRSLNFSHFFSIIF